MDIPSVSVVVSCEGQPVEGVLVSIVLRVVKKNDYHVIAGPTDANGKALLEVQTILLAARATLESALMDYAPIESSFSGEIAACVMDEQSIQKAINAYEMFKEGYPFVSGYENVLQQGLKRIRSFRGRHFQIETKRL